MSLPNSNATVAALLIAILLAGCGVGSKAVRFDDGSSGFVASCGGDRGHWDHCREAAVAACGPAYVVVEEEGFELQGLIKRNLYFKCRR